MRFSLFTPNGLEERALRRICGQIYPEKINVLQEKMNRESIR